MIRKLFDIIKDRRANPKEGSYTCSLFAKGRDEILKKIGEEASEVVIGAKNNKSELIYESADLLYHLFVLLVNEGIELEDIETELNNRYKG